MSRATDTIGPGSTLGVFGGGQLGRMFAQAATRMGYRVIVFAPERDCPASHVAAEHVCAPFVDEASVIEFARRCDAVTIEFENVPVQCLEIAGQHTPTRPGPMMLAAAQDRLKERAFLDQHGLPTSPHAAVESEDDLHDAVANLGRPGVIKSARFGYDGRGQVKFNPETDLADAWAQLNTKRAIYERWVEFDCEVSVLVARSPRGEIQTFGPIENTHANHILDISVVPARVDPATEQQAIEVARSVAEDSSLEGLICVEMFVRHDGTILINELAPRPHNSGHLTIEACAVNQFEQQVRAMCNLPLGRMTADKPTAMANLLGDHVMPGEPNWDDILATPEAALHLYGKTQVRRGRKMGHLAVRAETANQAEQLARTARATIRANTTQRLRIQE